MFLGRQHMTYFKGRKETITLYLLSLNSSVSVGGFNRLLHYVSPIGAGEPALISGNSFPSSGIKLGEQKYRVMKPCLYIIQTKFGRMIFIFKNLVLTCSCLAYYRPIFPDITLKSDYHQITVWAYFFKSLANQILGSSSADLLSGSLQGSQWAGTPGCQAEELTCDKTYPSLASRASASWPQKWNNPIITVLRAFFFLPQETFCN